MENHTACDEVDSTAKELGSRWANLEVIMGERWKKLEQAAQQLDLNHLLQVGCPRLGLFVVLRKLYIV